MQEMIVTVKSMLNNAGFGPVSIAFSFALGVLSAIASACCTLPLVGAVAGLSLARKEDRRAALWSALLFTIGTVVVLLAIGGIVIFFGQGAIKITGSYWKIAAGCMALLFGIGTLGLFPFKLPSLKFIPAFNRQNVIVSGFSGLVFGGAIAVTSLPCNPGIFIILGAAVLENHTLWAILNLTAYAFGFGIPLSAIFLGFSFGKTVVRLQKAEKVIRILAGLLLIAAALYLFYSF